jgi:hypothetical protein
MKLFNKVKTINGQRFELSQEEKDKITGTTRYGPVSNKNFNPMVGVQKLKPRVNIIKKQIKLSKKDAHNFVQLLLTYYRKSRAYHSHQFIRNILRPKKDKEQRNNLTKRMVDLGREMNTLADQIDKMFGE